MTPIAYVALLEDLGPEGYLVRFPDVPEAITQGATVEEASVNAADALAVALDGYIERHRDVPEPSEGLAPGHKAAILVPVDPFVAAAASCLGK